MRPPALPALLSCESHLQWEPAARMRGEQNGSTQRRRCGRHSAAYALCFTHPAGLALLCPRRLGATTGIAAGSVKPASMSAGVSAFKGGLEAIGRGSTAEV